MFVFCSLLLFIYDQPSIIHPPDVGLLCRQKDQWSNIHPLQLECSSLLRQDTEDILPRAWCVCVNGYHSWWAPHYHLICFTRMWDYVFIHNPFVKALWGTVQKVLIKPLIYHFEFCWFSFKASEKVWSLTDDCEVHQLNDFTLTFRPSGKLQHFRVNKILLKF